MKNNILLPAAIAWLTTLAAAYYMGSSQASAVVAESDLSSGSSTQLACSSIHEEGSRPVSNASRITSGGRSSASSSSTNSTTNASIQSISKLSDPIERSRQMLHFIDSLNPAAFEAAVADFRALGMTRLRMAEYNMLLHAWGKVDPLGAISYSQANTQSDHAVKEVLASWATDDSTAALAWAREHHDSDKANPYLVGIISGLADSNPTLATQILQELPYSKERGEAMRTLTPHIAGLGMDGAQQWLNSIEDKTLVSGAASQIADQFSKLAPVMGADWVSRIEDDEIRARALNKVVDNWTAQDPSAAQAWIATLPYEDQLKAGPEFVSSYAKQDANAAADWLDANASASNYQELLRKFSTGATRSDPVLALNYGNELNDENSRSRTVSRALWTLYNQDKAEALSWIQNNDLPEKVQRHANRMMDDK